MTTFCPWSIIDIFVESGLYFEKYVAELDKLLPITIFVMYINYELKDFGIWSKNQFVIV